MKETELFPLVKQYLENRGFEVFAEVHFKGTARYFDVIGLDFYTDRSICIEMKTSYNESVKRQASFNTNYFDETFVAIPRPVKIPKTIDTHPLWGILWLDLNEGQIEEIVLPQKGVAFRPTFENLLKRLFINDINKEIVGGQEITKVGLTASAVVLNNVVEFLKVHGPSDLKTIISHVSTHWKHPAGNLRVALLDAQDLPIEVDRTSRPYRFFYKENT